MILSAKHTSDIDCQFTILLLSTVSLGCLGG